RALDGRYRSDDVQNHAVRVRTRYREAIRFHKGRKCLVVCFRGTKALGKLRWGQVLAEVRTAGIDQLREKRVQFVLIAEGQADGHGDAIQPRHWPHSRGSCYRFRYVAMQ